MNKYEVLGVVGEGAYGVVLKCRNKESGEIQAIKKFKEPDKDEVFRKTTLREVKILRMLRHPNIVSLTEAFRRKGKLYLVFEYVEKNLLEVLEDQPQGLEPETVRQYIFQLIQAIHWCHSNDVLHRDIKPENLLINVRTQTLKLCDFGFARTISKTCHVLTDYVATRWYRAPELLIGSTAYSFGVDMWAVGCIMGEISDGEPLFPGETEVDQLYIVQRMIGSLTRHHLELFMANSRFAGLKFPDMSRPETLQKKYVGKISRRALHFMKLLLSMDPADRPTSHMCLLSPYFEGLSMLNAAANAQAKDSGSSHSFHSQPLKQSLVQSQTQTQNSSLSNSNASQGFTSKGLQDPQTLGDRDRDRGRIGEETSELDEKSKPTWREESNENRTSAGGGTDASPGPVSRQSQRSRRGVRESKATAEDSAEPSDYKESYHQLQQQQQQQKDSTHIKGSKQSPTKNGDGRTSKERDRDRQREHEKEAEKEKERLREREIRAFREFSKDLPFKQPSMPQIRRVAGSSYLPSSDFDIDENASHLPIPNILSNGANSSSSNSSSNSNHIGSSNGSGNGNNDGNNGPSSGTYYNTGTGGHVSLGPLGDTGIRLRGGLTGAPGPAPLAMSTGRPQIPSIECRSAAVQGNSSGVMNAHADTSTSQGQGYHGSSSSTDNGNNVVNSSNSSSNSSSSSRSSSHLNLNGSNSLGGSSSTLNIPGVPYRHQQQPLGNIPVQHSASNLTTHSQSEGQGQNSSNNNKYRDNPLSGSNNAYTAPMGPLTITTATASASSTLSCHSILGQNTELTSSSAFDDDIRHSGASSSSATHANTMAPGEHTFNAHNRLNSKGSLFDVRSDASFFSESDSTNYSTINSTMSTVMGVSTGSTRTGDMNAISSLMNMNGFTSSAASSHMGSASVSATSTLTMNLNSLNIRDRGAAGQSLLDPLDALHYSQLPLQTLPQIRDGSGNDMMTADSKTSTGTGTHSNGNGVSNTGGDGAPSLHGLGGIQGSKQRTRSRDHKHGTRNGKGKSSARSNQVTSNPHIQSQHQHSTRTLTHMQDKGTGGGAPKFR